MDGNRLSSVYEQVGVTMSVTLNYGPIYYQYNLDLSSVYYDLAEFAASDQIFRNS